MFSEYAEALVNTVNCVGVMGRGIAYQFKLKYPDNYRAYAKKCRQNDMQPGTVFVYETQDIMFPRYIINFPTKRHWRGKSRMEDIESGLASLVHEVQSRGIRSIVVPPLGSGLGGLEWIEVRERIERALQPLADVKAIVYEPGGYPVDRRANRSTDVPRMTPSRAVLVALIQRYLRGTADPFATLLEVHKLMYFMQVAGEPLKLRFTKGHYGPYAENLRHVLKKVEGHLVSGYADGGDTPHKRLDLVPGAARDAQAFLEQHPSTLERLERVAAMTKGFESSSSLELLATVRWSVEEKGVRTARDLADAVRAWNPSKRRRFTPRQVGIAAERLMRCGWIEDGPLLDSYRNRCGPPPGRERKLYSYVVRYDNGFAPNPFWNTCTLATCKPEIRRLAQVGDCIVGTGSKTAGRHEHLVFVMFVTEAMTFNEYWLDEWYANKKPIEPIRGGDRRACGDNIYYKLGPDHWHQRKSFHGELELPTDTKVDRVLASTDFAYWGGTGPKIPDRFLRDKFLVGRGYGSRFPKELIDDFVEWYRGLGANGRLADPMSWPGPPTSGPGDDGCTGGSRKPCDPCS